MSLHRQGQFRHPDRRGPVGLVERKTVTCTGGTITVSAVKGSAGGVLQQAGGGVLAPVNQAPKKSPVVANVPVFVAQR